MRASGRARSRRTSAESLDSSSFVLSGAAGRRRPRLTAEVQSQTPTVDTATQRLHRAQSRSGPFVHNARLPLVSCIMNQFSSGEQYGFCQSPLYRIFWSTLVAHAHIALTERAFVFKAHRTLLRLFAPLGDAANPLQHALNREQFLLGTSSMAPACSMQTRAPLPSALVFGSARSFRNKVKQHCRTGVDRRGSCKVRAASQVSITLLGLCALTPTSRHI